MSIYKRGKTHWTAFVVDGVLFRKSLGTSDRREAIKLERNLIDEARRGSLTARSSEGPKTLFAAVDNYLAFKTARATSPRTPELEAERLNIVKRHFHDVRLSAITAKSVAEYQNRRRAAGISNRTINMDVGALSRVLKHCGCWRRLKEHVKALPEGQAIIGRALTGEERDRLFAVAASNPEWEHVYCAAVVAGSTSLRPVEVKHLRRRDVDLFRKVITVTRTKTKSGYRTIPLNADALKALVRMVQRADALGFNEADHYLWFACQWGRFDPTRPMAKWDTAWRALREKAGLPGLRFYDLRHTFITELAEAGVADFTMESMVGHLSRRMLEHYSHIRMTAKRNALDALDEQRNRERDQQNQSGPTDTPQ